MNFDFSSLNLSGVEAQRGSTSLRPGRHGCRTSDAEIKTTQAGGKQVFVKLTEINGQGITQDYITVAHPKAATDEKAAMSVRIGLERLKALLTYGGHPNPDNPGDIKSINGLVVGVNVEEGDPWVDDKGVTRKGGGKPRQKGGAYFKASELGIATVQGGSSAATSAGATPAPAQRPAGYIPF